MVGTRRKVIKSHPQLFLCFFFWYLNPLVSGTKWNDLHVSLATPNMGLHNHFIYIHPPNTTHESASFTWPKPHQTIITLYHITLYVVLWSQCKFETSKVNNNNVCTNPVITAIGVDGCVEFWDEDDDLWVRNEAVLSDRPSSSTGVCWPEDEAEAEVLADKRHSSLTLSLVRICSSIWIFSMMGFTGDLLRDGHL